MLKIFTLTILVIISSVTLFLKYYSHNNSSTNNIVLVDDEKLAKIEQASELSAKNINHTSNKQDERKVIPVQSPVLQNDVDNLEQDEPIIPIQDVLNDVRGQEDENGVRHDINVWINQQDLNQAQKLALTQKARSLQKELVKAEEIQKLDQALARQQAEILAFDSLKAIKCMRENFNNESEQFKYADRVRELTLNTQARVEADKQIDQALSGGVLIYPEGDTCEK